MSQYRQSQCEMMLEAVGRASITGMTRKEFADLLHIKKGTHLNGLIDELLSRNLVIGKRSLDSHNRTQFIYFPNDLPAKESQS